MHRRPGKAHLNGPKTSERKARLSIDVAVGTSQLPPHQVLLALRQTLIQAGF